MTSADTSVSTIRACLAAGLVSLVILKAFLSFFVIPAASYDPLAGKYVICSHEAASRSQPSTGIPAPLDHCGCCDAFCLDFIASLAAPLLGALLLLLAPFLPLVTRLRYNFYDHRPPPLRSMMRGKGARAPPGWMPA